MHLHGIAALGFARAFVRERVLGRDFGREGEGKEGQQEEAEETHGRKSFGCLGVEYFPFLWKMWSGWDRSRINM